MTEEPKLGRLASTRYSLPMDEGRAAVAPRKLPRQSRSAMTVDAIIEAAARILEHGGVDGYTTNNVAERAGISIGSLYQYFPNKDAITRALIEREARAVAADAERALASADLQAALTALVAVAVGHQFRRPRLALLLEAEEERLEHALDLDAEASGVRTVLAARLLSEASVAAADAVASDVMRVIRAFSDAAAARGAADTSHVAQVIGGAVCGLVAAAAAPSG